MIAINPKIASDYSLYIQQKNNKKDKPSKDVNVQTFNASCSPVEFKHLSSKFNINFKGTCHNFDEFSAGLENKIEKMLDVNSSNEEVFRDCAIRSSRDIDNISDIFNNDGVYSIYSTSISLNSALNYLAAKGQIFINDTLDTFSSLSYAFMIDKLSTEYISAMKKQAGSDIAKASEYDYFLDCLKNNRIKFYCIAQDEKAAQELICKFEKAVDNPDFSSCDVKIIQNLSDTKPNYPDKDLIKRIMNSFIEYRFHGDESEKEKYIETVCKYIDECLDVFSYKTLASNCKKQYKIIEKEVEKLGFSMDDVIYTYPQNSKSYDLINYIYASVNNVPNEKFAEADEIMKDRARGINNDDKIFVVIDDFSASGVSLDNFLDMLKPSYNSKTTKRNIILSPIVSSEFAKEFLEGEAILRAKKTGLNMIYLPVNICRDFSLFSNIDALERYGKIKTKDIDDILQKHYDNYDYLNASDVDYLTDVLLGGYLDSYSCVIFPYMIPDNSSEITAVLGGYFLNKDTPYSNKALGQSCETANALISLPLYNAIKNHVECSLNNAEK